jgi:probable rRNA maturation factor
MLSVPVANNQARHAVDTKLLSRAARVVAGEHGFQAGEISIAVVDDETMHELNRRYLNHDYPTDVLSFVLEQAETLLEGEIIVSADYASREAPKYGWTLREELALYVIHGALHLVGYDDTTPEAKAVMQEQETLFLRKLAIERGTS